MKLQDEPVAKDIEGKKVRAGPEGDLTNWVIVGTNSNQEKRPKPFPTQLL